MDPVTIAAIAEIAKLGMYGYMSYMAQVGLTEAQVDAAFQEAKAKLFTNDPGKIPS